MKLLFVTIMSFSSLLLFGQSERSSQLYRSIRSCDSLLFNVGFNTCDITQFEKLLSDNFEFYHDKAGATLSKQAFIADIKDGLCKLSYKARRQLIDSTVEVYAMQKKGVLYGAIQTGVHQFYAKEKDNTEHLTSAAKFTHIWLLENGIWKLSRGMSYDHRDK
jgi:hypothetical protein